MWLELLKLEGLGFFQVEVVKDLSQKARVLSVLFLHGSWGSSNLAIYSSSGIESDSARYVFAKLAFLMLFLLILRVRLWITLIPLCSTEMHQLR